VLQPAIEFAAEHRYLERTNVLETVFETDRGRVKVTDALTIDSSQRGPWRELVREVEGLSGKVPMRWQLEPRPDYGRSSPNISTHKTAIVVRGGGIQIALRAWDAGAANVTEAGISATFEIGEGESATIAMLATEAEPLPVPGRDAARRRLRETADVWRSWVGRHRYHGPWRAAVERSLLAIKLLSDHRTGAIAAAGTTSLPEVLGGERNYDYRFGWVRDLCFTLDALLEVGMDELTEAAITWVLDATARTHPRIDPVYALGGSVVRDQHELPLSGYRRTGPVHAGNRAGSQLQLGGFGDLIETISKYVSAGHLLGPSAGERLADAVDLLTRIWRNPDSGLWELSDRADYGTSKLSAWVAFARILDLAADGHVPERRVDSWRRARDETRGFIERRLFSEVKNSYLFKAGSDDLDCGMLLAARRGFGDRARIIGTIEAIGHELSAGGPLLYRYSGMQDSENAFLACSFWMVEALALTGRPDKAAQLMNELVRCSSPLGLYSEEMEPSTGRCLATSRKRSPTYR
jgi:GH15 family glucan-1,4-alpha-glucosidase